MREIVFETKETEIVEKIISDVFSEKAVKISPLIDKGSVNQVFVVETKSSKFVFRMNDADFLDEYEKEIWSSRKAREKDVLVPTILKIGVFEEKAFSIQEFIEGFEGRVSPADKKFIWSKLGEYARRIHTVKVAGFGLKLDDLIHGNAEKSWLEYLEYNIESLNETDELRKLSVLTEAQSNIVRNRFEKLRLQKFKFGLNHGDLSLRNTIIDSGAAVHLIDWGSAEASIVPHHDLIQLLKENMLENDPGDAELQAFLAGYEISDDQYEKMMSDLKVLSLLRAFDKLRWAIDRKVSGLADYVFQAKETVRKFL